MREPQSIRIKVTFLFHGMISDENGLNASYTFIFTVKPVFHGACFEADSAPILYAPYPRRVRPCLARIRRGQSRRRIRFKTRSMENGLYTSEITNMLTFGGFKANAIVVNVGCMHRAIDRLIFEKTTGYNRSIGNGLPKNLMLQ